MDTFAADDGESPVHGIEAQTDGSGAVRLEQHGRHDFQVFNHLQGIFRALFQEPALEAGCERHLDEPRGRQHGTAAHHVVGIHRQRGEIELVFPVQCLPGQGVAEQRVQNLAREPSLRFEGARLPVPFTLPRVMRQIHATPRRRKLARPIAQAAAEFQLCGQLAQAVAARVFARQARQHQSCGAQGFGDGRQVSREHRAWADLDEGVDPGVHHGADRRLEIHPFTDVAPPVSGVDRVRSDAIAGHRGIHRQGRRPHFEAAERIDQIRTDRIHRIAVERIVQGEALTPDMALCEGTFELRHRLNTARQGDGVRAVDRGEGQPLAEPKLGQQLDGLILPQGNGGHASLAARTALVRTAFVNHAHGLIQRQGTARPGGGYFADAVAADGDRPHTAALERPGESDLDGEQRRLRDFGQFEPVFARCGVEFRENGLAAALCVHLVDLDECVAKHRIVRKQLQAHAGPLRAVARVHKGGSRGLRAMFAQRYSHCLAGGCELLERQRPGVPIRSV